MDLRETTRRGLVGSLLLLAGGLVTAPLPASSPLAGLWPVAELRASMPGRMLGLLVVVTGIAVLGAAWLQLARRMGSGYDASRAVTQVTLVWSAPLLVAPPLFSRDGWSYAAQGRMTALGISPYDWGPGVLFGPITEAVDPRWLTTATPYGPLPLLWGALPATVTADPWTLVVWHRLLALAGVLLLAWAVPRLAAWTGRDPGLATWLTLPAPLMLAHGVAGLHNDVLMAGLMTAALVVGVERGWLLGAALGGAAAAVKLPGGLVCIAVAVASLPVAATTAQRLARLAATAVVAVAVLVGLGAVGGVGVGWVDALGVPGEVRTPLSLSTQVGSLLELLFSGMELTTPADASVPWLRLLGSLAALLLAAYVALGCPAGERALALRWLGLLMLSTFLLSPVVHHWYALWFVPLLAAVPLGARATNALAATALVLGVVAPLDSSLEGRLVAIVLTTALVAVVALALLGRLHGLLPAGATRLPQVTAAAGDVTRATDT